MKVGEREFLEFAAGILGILAEKLSLETTYGSIPEWDSIAQLRLVTEIAAKYKVEIPFAEVVNVTSLWEFLRRVNGGMVKRLSRSISTTRSGTESSVRTVLRGSGQSPHSSGN